MDYPIPIPQKSLSAWRKHNNQTPQNPGLIFDRFTPIDPYALGKSDKPDSEVKKRAWQEVEKASRKIDVVLLRNWNMRWEAVARTTNAEPLSLKTDWRFVTGLGRKGPLEVGFTFNLCGFPVLPGSSVKGIARAWAVFILGGEDRAKANPDFMAIFGCAPEGKDEGEAQSGRAVFFDAIPSKMPKLELDIMNPHFPDYYSDDKGRTPPTDSQSPVPVYFLTVAKQQEFSFAVGWRGPMDGEAIRLRNKAKEWLVSGLTELGAGAKTSAGYGYFQPPEVAAPTSQRAITVGEVAPPVPTVAPVQTRHGVIVEIDTSGKQSGRVRDLESGEVYGFSTRVIEGNTPGRKAQVIFDLRDGKVIRVKRG